MVLESSVKRSLGCQCVYAMFVFKSMFSVALIAVVFFRYLLMRRRWRSELMAQSEARVQALQARICGGEGAVINQVTPQRIVQLIELSVYRQ